MTNAVKRHLEARIAALSQLEPAPGIAPLDLQATFHSPRLFRRFPTRPRRSDGSWQEDTSIRPRLDARDGSRRARRTRDFMRVLDWLDLRRSLASTPGPTPLVVLGGPGSGKSTLLAWEYCERARMLLTSPDGVATEDRAAIPVHVPASLLALPTDPRGAAATSFWHGETTRLIKRIVDHVASARGAVPEALRAELRQELTAELAAGRVVLLMDDFDRLTARQDGALEARASFARNLRLLLTTCAGIDVIMTARFVDVRAPEIGELVWRVWELLPWEQNEITAFVRHFAAQRVAQPTLGRRLHEVLTFSSSIEELAATPQQLALLCSAVAEDTSAAGRPLASTLQRVAALQLDRAGIVAGERERVLTALARLALSERREAPATLEARDVACLAAADLVESSGDAPSWRVAEPALRDAFTAAALADMAAGLDELGCHLACDDARQELVPLIAGLLRGAGGARPEDLLAMILDDPSSSDADARLGRATACAAMVPDLAPRMLERIVAVVRRALDDVAAKRGSNGHAELGISIDSGSQFRITSEDSICRLGSRLGDLWRGHASSAALEPLRRALHALIVDDDPLLRRRGVDLARAVAAYDPGLRDALLARLTPRLEPDDDVRSAVAHAASSLAGIDWRTRELLVAALDAQRERDVSVRSAAAMGIGTLAAHDARLRDVAIAALDARREPSDTVRRELIHALRWTWRRESPRMWHAYLGCLTGDPDPAVRAAAASALLVGAGEDRDVAAGLLDHLDPRHERHAEVRESAARSLRRPAKDDPLIREALVRRLEPRRERSADVRAAAAGALRFAAPTEPRVRVALLARLDPSAEREPDVRRMALFGLELAAADDAQVRARFCAVASSDPAEEVRHTALSALVDEPATMAPEVRRLLPRFLDCRLETDHNVRRTATRSLGRLARSDRETRRLLLARLAECSGEDDARASLVLTLAAFVAEDPEVRAAVLPLLDPRAEPKPGVRHQVVHALGHALELDAVREVLRSRLTRWREPDASVRCAAVRILGKHAADAAVRDTLVGLLDEVREPDARVRAFAADALHARTDLPPELRARVVAQLPTSVDRHSQVFADVFCTFGCAACIARRDAEAAVFDVP